MAKRPADPNIPSGDDLAIRHVPLDQARRWDRNPKKHDFGALIQSIARYGFKDPPKFEPTLNRGKGGIVEGNGRAEALAMMQADGQEPPRGVSVDVDGRWCMPVLFGVDARSKSEAESYGIDHNNLTLMGGDLGIDAIMGLWEEDALTELLTALGQDGELPGSLDGEDLDALLGVKPEAQEDPGPQIDRAAELQEKWGTARGQVWEIPLKTAPGKSHRLMCGDSTSADDVGWLMAGEIAEVVWTDAPYGVSYVGGTKDALTIENDGAAGLPALLDGAFAAADRVMAPGARFYLAAPAGPNGTEFRLAVQRVGWRLHQVLVWVKSSLVLGHSDYHYRHEDVLYGWKPGPGRAGRGNHAGSRWQGDNSQTTVFEVDKPTRSADHPTMKPVELISPMLKNSSLRGDVVLEPFAGSGSTVVACEHTGRICRAVEISPGYAAVILQRLSDMGLQPNLVTEESVA